MAPIIEAGAGYVAAENPTNVHGLRLRRGFRPPVNDLLAGLAPAGSKMLQGGSWDGSSMDECASARSAGTEDEHVSVASETSLLKVATSAAALLGIVRRPVELEVAGLSSLKDDVELHSAKCHLSDVYPWPDLVRRSRDMLVLRDPVVTEWDLTSAEIIAVLERAELRVWALSETPEDFLQQCPPTDIYYSAMVPEKWGEALLAETPTLRKARYVFVPRLLTEDVFWSRYLSVVFDVFLSELRVLLQDKVVVEQQGDWVVREPGLAATVVNELCTWLPNASGDRPEDVARVVAWLLQLLRLLDVDEECAETISALQRFPDIQLQRINLEADALCEAQEDLGVVSHLPHLVKVGRVCIADNARQRTTLCLFTLAATVDPDVRCFLRKSTCASDAMAAVRAHPGDACMQFWARAVVAVLFAPTAS